MHYSLINKLNMLTLIYKYLRLFRSLNWQNDANGSIVVIVKVILTN